MEFTVEEILRATKGRLIVGLPTTKISSFSIDSRTIKQGALFVAIKGNRFDGHDFIAEAIKKGARVIISQIMPKKILKRQLFWRATIPKSYSWIIVSDTTNALGDVAHHHRKLFNIPVIAITGSNGKTTTKEMLAWVLKEKYHVLNNEGTQNNQIGVALTLLRMNRRHQLAVLEIGTNHFGEVKRLSQIIEPTVGVITNIGPAHLEFFGNLKGVFREKSSLLKYLKLPAISVLNKDDKLIRNNLKNPAFKKRFNFTFGLNTSCDFKASKMNLKNSHLEFFINERWKFVLNTMGWYNIYNVLTTVACGRIFGLDYPALIKRLRTFKFPSGRLKIERYKGFEIIDDTYNSNPLSLEYALAVLSNYPSKGRKIFVIGDMLELGRQEDRLHYSIGRRIASFYIDMLLTVGSLTKITAQAACDTGMDKSKIFSCEKSSQAAQILLDFIRPTDTLLIKGSRRMRMEEIIKILKENK